MAREDFQLRQFAKDNGFTESFNVNDRERTDNPLHPIQFRRGDTFVWACSLGWQVADLIGTNYVNHRPEKNLQAALDKVLEEQK
jgi:hypothetical protein